MSKERAYLVLLVAVIGIGVLSRLIPTDNVILGKYLGDALYAAMVYILLALLMRRIGTPGRFVLALILMVGIELFQLTHIPLGMRSSETTVFRLLSILLGTTFSWYDIAAYLIGLIMMVGVDISLIDKRRHPR